MQISIIVPVYKAESTIRRCIDSIIAQTYNDWELILVDDGSPDYSGEICDSYSSDRVHVIHTNNEGVSAARNKGLDLAHGERICFVDSDDFISPAYLEAMSHSTSDFVAVGFTSVNSYMPIAEKLDKEEISNRLQELIDGHNLCAVWSHLYSSSIIKQYNIRFDTNLRFGEDTIFNLQYFSHCTTYETVPDVSYQYYQMDDYSKRYVLDWTQLSYLHNKRLECYLLLEEIFGSKVRIATYLIPSFQNVPNLFSEQKASKCYELYRSSLGNHAYMDYMTFFTKWFDLGQNLSLYVLSQDKVSIESFRIWRSFLDVPYDVVCFKGIFWKIVFFLFKVGQWRLASLFVNIRQLLKR